MSEPIKVAAVQMAGRVGDVPYNISHVADFAEQALRGGARIVALPEFFTTPIVYDERLYKCSMPKGDNPALDMMKSLSSKYEAMVGGSYLEYRNGDVYNTYILVEADGTMHKHDKDLPTMVENAFYIGGQDDGFTQTALGNVGMAVCWETIRNQTVSRLKSRLDLLMTGSHWWSVSENWYFPVFSASTHRKNLQIMKETPGTFARLIGAPSLHASHCGHLSGDYLITSKRTVPSETGLVGEAQIVDASGKIIARRKAEEGPGVISGEIILGGVAPEEQSQGFWIPNLPLLIQLMWWQQNIVAKKVYLNAKKGGKIETYDFKKNSQLEKD